MTTSFALEDEVDASCERSLLIVQFAGALLELAPPLFVHLFVCSPGEQEKCTDDEDTAQDSSWGERRVERRRKQLVDERDDEDSQQRSHRGQHGARQAYENEEGPGECCVWLAL